MFQSSVYCGSLKDIMTLRQAIGPSQDLYMYTTQGHKIEPTLCTPCTHKGTRRYIPYFSKLGIRWPLHVPTERSKIPGVDLLKITQNHGYKRTLNENAQLRGFRSLPGAGHSNLRLHTVTVTLPLG